MRDQRRGGATFRYHALGRIVACIEIEVRQVADQAVGPVGSSKADLLAGHEFQRTVRAEVQHGVRSEILTEPAIEGREGMRRRKAAFEHQAHRVALVSEARLQADEHISELSAQHEYRAAIRELTSRRRAPLAFNLREVPLPANMIIRGDAGMDIGIRTKALRVAFKQLQTKIFNGAWNLCAVSTGFHRLQRIVQRCKHRKVGG